MRTLILLAGLALAAAAGGYAAYRVLGPAHGASPDIAPSLVFTDLQGGSHALDQLRGRWVLLNFWATWCAPCMDELPLLIDAQRKYAARGLQILGPALDTPDAVGKTASRVSFNYPVMAGFDQADQAMQKLGNKQGALPYSVLIDPQGRVVETHLGNFTGRQLEILLTEHLPEAG